MHHESAAAYPLLASTVEAGFQSRFTFIFFTASPSRLLQATGNALCNDDGFRFDINFFIWLIRIL
jgi:hypothetical protein